MLDLPLAPDSGCLGGTQPGLLFGIGPVYGEHMLCL